RRQPAHRLGVGLAVGVKARAEAVGHAATADGDAALARALAVAVGVGEVAEDLVAGPADLRPGLGRQRLGDDLGRVQRQPVVAAFGETRAETLGRAQDHAGAHAAACGAHLARTISGNRGV